MVKKKSSFHMGDEFNGKGQKVYLRATKHNTYTPLSQQNVRMTTDFTRFAPMALGAMPLVMNPSGQGLENTLKALGGLPDITQIFVKKNDKENYVTSFKVKKIQLTTGSYLHTATNQEC